MQYGKNSLQNLQYPLEGLGPFWLVDENPSATFRATLVGECVIKVQSADIRPSDQTLRGWSQTAKEYVASLNESRGALDLASHVETISELTTSRSATLVSDLWVYLDTSILTYSSSAHVPALADGIRHFTDSSGTRLLSAAEMKAKGIDGVWQELLANNLEANNYFVTISSVQSLQASLPPPFSPAETARAMAGAKTTVVGKYQAILKQHIDDAAQFLSMTKDWKDLATKDFNQARAALNTAFGQNTQVR